MDGMEGEALIFSQSSRTEKDWVTLLCDSSRTGGLGIRALKAPKRPRWQLRSFSPDFSRRNPVCGVPIRRPARHRCPKRQDKMEVSGRRSNSFHSVFLRKHGAFWL